MGTVSNFLRYALCHADSSEALNVLCANLQHVDSFYDSIGGLAGYQLKCLEMMMAPPRNQPKGAAKQDAAASSEETKFHMPQGLDIAGHHNRRAAAVAAATGLEALPYMAEILPLGGMPTLLLLRGFHAGNASPFGACKGLLNVLTIPCVDRCGRPSWPPV